LDEVIHLTLTTDFHNVNFIHKSLTIQICYCPMADAKVTIFILIDLFKSTSFLIYFTTIGVIG
jgi:hypothetical protein